MDSSEREHLVVSAPGKVILHGEHAVVHGRRALACSLNLRTFLHVTKTDNSMVKISLPDIGISECWPLKDLQSVSLNINRNQGQGDGEPDKECEAAAPLSPEGLKQICEFLGYNQETQTTKELAVVAFVYLYTRIKRLDESVGLDFLISSNLPTGAGLGSSAAFAVALVSSLLQLSGKIGNPGEESFNKWPQRDLDLINSWAFMAEKIIHGNPSGVDNSMSSYGGVAKYQNKKLERLDCKHELKALITNTKVARSTKHMVSIVGDKLRKYPAVIEPTLDAIDAISAQCQQQLTSSQPMDVNAAQEMFTANQLLLSVLGVSHPALEEVCRLTASSGLASKLTGAGGGGCAITLLPEGIPESTISSVIESLRSCGYDCWQTAVGGPGVGLHRSLSADGFTIPTALQSKAESCHIL